MVLSLPISHLQIEFHATASFENFPHLPPQQYASSRARSRERLPNVKLLIPVHV